MSSTELLFLLYIQVTQIVTIPLLFWFNSTVVSVVPQSRIQQQGWVTRAADHMNGCCITCAACRVWLCQPASSLTPLLVFSKVLSSALFLNCFFFEFLVFKIFPCLYSTPFSPAATSVPNSDTCSVSPVLQSQS